MEDWRIEIPCAEQGLTSIDSLHWFDNETIAVAGADADGNLVALWSIDPANSSCTYRETHRADASAALPSVPDLIFWNDGVLTSLAGTLSHRLPTDTSPQEMTVFQIGERHWLFIDYENGESINGPLLIEGNQVNGFTERHI